MHDTDCPKLLSDNGACFTSREFTEFLKSNCIRHITTASYHPASNGLAERVVKIIKDGLKKLGTGDLRERLARFLFQYRDDYVTCGPKINAAVAMYTHTH